MITKTIRVVSLALAVLLSAPAWSSVVVTPTQAEVSVDSREQVFLLKNDSAAEIDVQVVLSPWQTEWKPETDTERHLLKNKGLLVYPPVARVRAQGQQVFRLILRDRNVEDLHLYRLNISWKGASSPDAGSEIAVSPGYSLPVFVTAPKAEHQLHYRVVSRDNGEYLVLENHGTRPVYIQSYRWGAGDAIPFYAYAWPGVTRYFRLPRSGSGEITLKLRTYGWTPSSTQDYVSIY